MKTKYNRLILYILFIILFISLSACANEIENEIVVQTQSQDNEIPFKQITVSKDDVILTESIKCVYKETVSQSITFNTTGKLVDKVYVKVGETVKKGDLLCELSAGNLEDQIEDFEYKIAKNELLLGYLDTKEALDVQDRWILNMQFPADKSDVEDDVQKIYSSYDKQRLSYNDSLEFDRLKLSELKKELADSRVYATIDGVVHYIKPGLVGSTSKSDVEVMSVVDNTACLFEVDDVQYASLFKEGQSVNMHVSSTKAVGDYILMPFEIDKWGDSLLFEVIESPENSSIDVGTSGKISVVIDKKENVLSLPNNVVYAADDRHFVYVLNKDNFRELRWVDIGLIGDTLTEITDGLNEGDTVVKK